MKNVAGYDMSRTLTGSLGTLAVLLDITSRCCRAGSRTSPCCSKLHSRARPCPLQSLGRTATAAERPAAISTTQLVNCVCRGRARGLPPPRDNLGGEQLDESAAFWEHLGNIDCHFSSTALPLWRLSIRRRPPPLPLDGDCLMDWGGAQRWLNTEPACRPGAGATHAAGGHATLFRSGDRSGEMFHPLPAHCSPCTGA